MKYKKNFEKYTPFATSALLTTRVRPCVEQKGEHWILSNNIFQFGKKFGACTNGIMVFQLMMSNGGRSWTGSVSRLIRNTRENQNKSSCNRYCWRWLRNWKGRVSMRKTRAEPKHKLENFTRWSREIIATNKRKDRDGSPPQHVKLTSKKTEKR